MNENLPTPDGDTLPVTAARIIAFCLLGMSIGFVLVIYFFFFSVTFSGIALWLMLCLFLTTTMLSSVMVLKKLRFKLLCSGCKQPFFADVMALFMTPKHCVSCGEPVSINDTVV
ncbi:MAG: hypothetical protein ACWIPH_02495 [Ostreibacterium sp.]